MMIATTTGETVGIDVMQLKNACEGESVDDFLLTISDQVSQNELDAGSRTDSSPVEVDRRGVGVHQKS